jgi:hypothetical protein
VESEESGAGDEAHGHEQQACIASRACGDTDRETKGDRESGSRQHQPEVRRLVLPLRVELGLKAQRTEHHQWGDRQ